MIGDPYAIEYTPHQLRKYVLLLKIKYNFRYYIYCEINFSDEKNLAWLVQRHFISNITKIFGGLVNVLQTYKTPVTSNLNIISNMDEMDTVTK